MTNINFYFNVADKASLIAYFLKKSLERQWQTTVFTANRTEAESLSQALWMQQDDPAAFIGHMLANDALVAESPVVLDWQAETITQDDLLINVQSTQILFFSRFKQMLEIVGLDEHDKIEARKRFAFYRDRGYEIKHVDMLDKSK